MHAEGPATGQLDQGFPWFSTVLKTQCTSQSHCTQFTQPSTAAAQFTWPSNAVTLSGRPVNADTRARSQDSPSGIYGGRSGTGTSSYFRTSFFVSIIPPTLHSPPVSIIPPTLHSPLSVSFHQRSTLPCQYHSTNAPLSPVSITPPTLHSPLSVSLHQRSTHLHLHVALNRRTNGRSLATFQTKQ